MKDRKLVLLARYHDLSMANIAKSILDSYDIPCFLFDTYHASVAWHALFAIGGIRLMVPASYFDEAQKILKEICEADNPDPPPLLPPTKEGKWSLLVSFLATLFFALPVILKGKDK